MRLQRSASSSTWFDIPEANFYHTKPTDRLKPTVARGKAAPAKVEFVSVGHPCENFQEVAERRMWCYRVEKMSPSFETISAVTAVGEGEYVTSVPDGWQQGRGAYGGLVLGTMLRAMIAAEPDAARAARCLTGDLCGPVLPGEARIRTEILRRGSNQTNVRATLRQGDAILATTTAVLSAPRRVASSRRGPTPPSPPPWRELAVVPLVPPVAPVFSHHFEYRNAGPAPFTGSAEASAAGWIRPKTAPAQVDAPFVVGLLDTWWPAMLATQTSPRATVTVSFTAELFVDPASLDPSAPLFHRGRVEAADEGFFVEFRELWTEDGRLVAMNQQTMAQLT